MTKDQFIAHVLEKHEAKTIAFMEKDGFIFLKCTKDGEFMIFVRTTGGFVLDMPISEYLIHYFWNAIMWR